MARQAVGWNRHRSSLVSPHFFSSLLHFLHFFCISFSFTLHPSPSCFYRQPLYLSFLHFFLFSFFPYTFSFFFTFSLFPSLLFFPPSSHLLTTSTASLPTLNPIHVYEKFFSTGESFPSTTLVRTYRLPYIARSCLTITRWSLIYSTVERISIG